MTVYTELLRDRVGTSRDPGQPLGALVADLLTKRARLVPEGGAPGAVPPVGSGGPERLAEVLDYDESLVRLCDRLGIRHTMLDPFAPPGARDAAEQALARRLPLLALLEEAPAC